VARQALNLMSQWLAISLSLTAAACLADLGPRFYRALEPKRAVTIFALLIIAAAITAQSDLDTTDSMAPESSNECARITGKPDSLSRYASPSRQRR
jgi:hypothetical protein